MENPFLDMNCTEVDIREEGYIPNEYEQMTDLDWVEYEFATIEYDFQIHPTAAKRIRALFERLYERSL